MPFLDNISHIGDIFAIPFFLLLIQYFAEKPRLTIKEKWLFLFAVSGFILDIYFTIQFLI